MFLLSDWMMVHMIHFGFILFTIVTGIKTLLIVCS